jgi:quinol monooxygenase YgiN
MSVLVLLRLSTKPGQLDAVRDAFADMLPDTRKFAGCEGATLHVDRADASQIVLVERWRSSDDYDAYVAWRQSQGSRLAELVTAPPSMTVFDDVDV